MPSTASMLLNFRSCAVFVFESDPRQLEKHRSKEIQFSSPPDSFASRNDRSSPMDIFEEGGASCRIRLIYEFLFSSFVYFRWKSEFEEIRWSREQERIGCAKKENFLRWFDLRWQVKRKGSSQIVNSTFGSILCSSSSFENCCDW